MIVAIGTYLALLYVTWIFFLAVMALKIAKDGSKLPAVTLRIAYPVLLVGYLLDFSLNMASSFLFLEAPQEWLLTNRCERHLRDSSGWDKALATWLCANLLDPFQIGGHCH